MKLDRLLSLPLNAELMVDNEPFTLAGRADIELDGGDARHWLFSADGMMLAVAPEDEELVLFRSVDEELEPENEAVVYQGKDYEFSYEDVGLVGEVAGDARVESDERYAFSDFESDGGEVVRLVRNENSGDQAAYVGSMVAEGDVVEVE